jgi:hypothetical protein
MNRPDMARTEGCSARVLEIYAADVLAGTGAAVARRHRAGISLQDGDQLLQVLRGNPFRPTAK